MIRRTVLLVVLATTVLPAVAGASSSPTLNRTELLKAAYPEWDGQRIELPDVAWPWAAESAKNTTSASDSDVVEIVPMNVIRLDDRHAVMVTWARPLADDGTPQCDSYGCLYAVGAYFFTLTESGWIVSRRDEVAAQVYTSGPLKSRVLAWPGHGYLLSMALPFSAQGDEMDDVFLMGVQSDEVSFTGKIPIAESNSQSYEQDCNLFLDAKHEPRQRHGYEQGFECRSGEGKWRIDGDAIAVRYEQLIRGVDANGRLRALKHTIRDVRLVPEAGGLQVVSGELPQFGF